jgi:hypothetical protein
MSTTAPFPLSTSIAKEIGMLHTIMSAMYGLD